MKRLLLFLPFIGLMSCGSILNQMRQPTEKKLDATEIDYQKEIDIESEYVNISAGVGINLNSFSISSNDKSDINYGLNLSGTYHYLNLGEVSFDAYLPVYRPNSLLETVIYANKLKKGGDFDFSLKVPFLKQTSVKDRKVGAIDDSGNHYIITGLPVLTYHKSNARVGIFTHFSNVATTKYIDALDRKGAYSNIVDFTDAFAEYSQRNTILRTGLEYQFLANSFIDILDKDNTNYYSSLSTIWSVYFDALLILNHSANFTEYSYVLKDENGLYPEINEIVYPSDFLSKRKFGLVIGMKSAVIPKEGGKPIITYHFEVGLTPGYFTNNASAMFLKYSLNIGLGGFKNIFSK